MLKGKAQAFLIISASLFLTAFIAVFFFLGGGGEVLKYSAKGEEQKGEVATVVAPAPKPRVVTHIKTPEPLKAVYISAWVAGSPSIRDRVIKMIDETELNAIVIDVKDSTGVVSFEPSDSYLKNIGSAEKRIADVENLIDELHSKNIYAIARIAVFQDPYLAKKRPDLAVYSLATGAPWKDRKGLSWMEAGAEEVWDYNIAVAKEAWKVGFDELNFDYIRFPSDGDMDDVGYKFYNSDTTAKAEQMRLFFEYLNKNLEPLGAPLSADLFGMVTTNADDLGIGQVLENAAPYFDYIAPMVYPSHYPKGFHGYKNPATVPYEVVNFTLNEGVKKLVNASTTPSKLRPWLQDFDLGATYTAEMVRAQIKATNDAGLTSWMLWDPSNKYTPSALLKE